MQQDLPNFDTLLRLAQEDPKQLEVLRIQLAQNTINEAPEYLRPRLRGLQFQIDSKRQLAKTPLAACIQLSAMMHNSFNELCDLLHGKIPTKSRKNKNKDDGINADILMFPSS